MKKYSLFTAFTVLFTFFVQNGFAQSINLGSAAGFVLFTTVGAVSNTGTTHLTGNIGTNSATSTAFGNVDGVIHDSDGASAQCAADLLIAYNQLNATIPTFFPAALMGNGQTLNAGIYSIGQSTSLNNTLILDGQGDANAVFIFKINGTFSTGVFSEVKLINGAQACNVFWKIEGMVSIQTGTTMVGNIIANNAAINMYTGVKLEGRALSTTGAVTVNGVTAALPLGYPLPILNGPTAPTLGSTTCFALFSITGDINNTGITYVTGDIGTNATSTLGFESVNVTGTIHLLPDAKTSTAADDLSDVYNYLNTLPFDIKLMYPAQFGNNLVLTPHTYLMDAAAVLTDTISLNAQGNENAVFVLKINGAFSTSTNAYVKLINGAQAKNVYWKIEGAVAINEYSVFKGTIVANAGAISLKTGVAIEGRALATSGAIATAAITAVIPSPCLTTGFSNPKKIEKAVLYPNPMKSAIVVSILDADVKNSSQLKIYNSTGVLLLNSTLTNTSTTIETNFPSGIYFYKLTSKDNKIQTGKLISK